MGNDREKMCLDAQGLCVATGLIHSFFLPGARCPALWFAGRACLPTVVQPGLSALRCGRGASNVDPWTAPCQGGGIGWVGFTAQRDGSILGTLRGRLYALNRGAGTGGV